MIILLQSCFVFDIDILKISFMRYYIVNSSDKQVLITFMFRLITMTFGKRSFVNNGIFNSNENNENNTRQPLFSRDSVA